MALTKINFYIGLLFFVGVFSVGFLMFGREIASKNDITVDNESLEYIDEYAGYFDNYNIGELNETDIKTWKEDEMISAQNETGEQSITDFLATLNWYKEKVGKIKNYIKLIFNIPSFMLVSIGLPIEPFSVYINIIGVALFISVLVLLIKLIRGS